MTDRLASTTPLPVQTDDAERIMREFYLSSSYDPKAARHADVERIDALIDMIIATYHTTRIIDKPVALHIRTRLGDRLTKALSSIPRDTFQAGALAMREAAAKEAEARVQVSAEATGYILPLHCDKHSDGADAAKAIRAIDPASLVLSPQEPAVTK